MEKNSPAYRLAQMGCGSEIINSVIERGNIRAMLYNVREEYKYLRYALKEKIYMADIVADKKAVLLQELITIEPLVNKYHELHLNEYTKLKTSLSK